MTPHINAKKDEISPVVIMPGDPKRAAFIAENYLTDYKLVSDVRAIPVYTGYYKDKKVTVMASGMGMPSMAIYAYELFKFYDVEKIIRVGTCGALNANLNLKDILLTEASYTNSNITIELNGEENYIVKPSKELNEKAKEIAKEKNISLIPSKILTTDAFYKDTYEYKYDAVEMETFILLYIAKILNKEAASILTVSDSIITKESLSSEDREKTLTNAITLALETL